MPFFPILEKLPDDPILKIPVEFKADPRKEKVNLGVGAYRNSQGKAWILPSVKEAETLLLEAETDKEYLPIQGHQEFLDALAAFIFGKNHPLVKGKRLASLQTIGGTGSLRILGDLIHATRPGKALYLSDPSWPNHNGIFAACGLSVETYPYYDSVQGRYLHNALIAALNAAPKESPILLHGCCHNPTGIDPSEDEWKEIFAVCKERGHFAILDIAYHGFGTSFEQDALPARLAADHLDQFALCYSCSKNMGLYGERLGMLAVAFQDAGQAANGLTHLKKIVRGSYSSPPLHGSSVAAKILTHSDLKGQWQDEVKIMRERIQTMRKKLAAALPEKSDLLLKGKGLFALLDLTPQQVDSLKKERGVYLPQNGRINVAGLTDHNLEFVVEALKSL